MGKVTGWPWPDGISAKTAEKVAELTKNEEFPEVEFQGTKFILVGGSLTTLEDFHHFRPSYAHVFLDGKIRRFGEVIGDSKELRFFARETTE